MAGGEDPLFLHASSRSPFLGSRSMVNFGGFRCSNGSIQRQFDYQESVLEDELEEYLNYQPEKKRRLSVEQVRFLEKCFELENKLEPERKIQLANDLGLQPRQISIWFQNRRARWKTKQLEKDYANLKAGYDILKADYENLVKDKDKLKREISLLTDKLLDKEKGKTSCSEISTPNSKRDEPQKPTAESLSEYEVAKPAGKQEEINSTNTVDFYSDSLREYSNGIQFKAARDSFCHVFEHEQSDLSQAEDREFSKTQFPHCVFPKVEDVNCSDPLVASGSFAEDTAFWSWTY